jgi:hypothetical protein
MSSIPASGTPPVSSSVQFGHKPFLLFFTARKILLSDFRRRQRRHPPLARAALHPRRYAGRVSALNYLFINASSQLGEI